MAKILAISHDAHLYGAQRSFLAVVEGLAAAGHEVETCLPDAGPLAQQLARHGIPVHLLHFSRWIPSSTTADAAHRLRLVALLPLRVARACRLVRAGRYDVVYTNTVTVLDFALAARLRGVPHVWHLREAAAGNPQLKSPLSNAGTIALVRALSARVIFNSRYLQSRYGAPVAGKDAVVYNGLQPAAATQRRPRGRGERLVLLTAGYMNRGKGLDVLLDALALLPPLLRERVTLRVAGDFEQAWMAQEIAPRLAALGAGVELLGWVDGIGDLLAQTDLLVSSARDEPFGRTLIEAMMAGVPVLATRSGGPQEIVVDGRTGILVPSEDPAALSAGLARLLEHPELLESYGPAGREHALAQFSLRSCVRGVEQCLLDAITGTGTSPVRRP